MAAFRSRTVGFNACQFGSKVPPSPTGDTRGGVGGGEPGLLAGCITLTYQDYLIILIWLVVVKFTCNKPPESFWGRVCGCECPACRTEAGGGERLSEPFVRVSATKVLLNKLVGTENQSS